MNSHTPSSSSLRDLSSYSAGRSAPYFPRDHAGKGPTTTFAPPSGQAAASFARSLAQGNPAAFLPDGCNMHLFPDGEFSARDGRPAIMEDVSAKTWVMNAAIAERLIAQVESQKTPLVVDYEHQTLAAAENGKPAPAAGWITRFVHVPGQGLFARAEWTETAQKHIAAGEYRYISPVFLFDRSTGAVTRLLHAALTNFPALDGLTAVAARHAPIPITEESTMTESLGPVSAAPGLPETADAAAMREALETQGESSPRASGRAAPRMQEESAALAAVAALQRANAALAERLAASERRAEEAALSAAIDAALADGRLPRSLAAWARDLGDGNPAALRAYLAGAKPIVALTGMQTSMRDAGERCPHEGLSADDAYAADTLGISRVAFAKLRSGI